MIFCFDSAVAEGIPADNPHLVLLFFMSQLFLRELTKCHRLVQIIPMDMSGYYGITIKYFFLTDSFIDTMEETNVTLCFLCFQIIGLVRQIWGMLSARFYYVNK